MSAPAPGPPAAPADVAGKAAGKVITFYSFKGGTGRSMTLANVAWILASNGKRVLVADWDLEAPGLHRYFAPFLLDPELTATPGLMDLLVDFATETVSGSGDVPADWYRQYAGRILRYVVSLEWRFAGKGTLDLLPAGRQGAQYAALLNGFNWQAFYDRQGGGHFIDAVKEQLRGLYDYVLVDSRTGVSDTAGICTVQLPDTLVACFTLNNQGINGAAAVAASAFQQRRAGGGLRVLPVPMRIENAENTKLQARWELAKRRLAPFPVLDGTDRDQYWSEVAVRYKPFYAYEEVLATFGDRPDDPIPLLPSAERLTAYLTDGEVQRLVPPDEQKRLEVLALYAGIATQPAAGLEGQAADADAVYARLTPDQQEAARRLFTRLVEVLPAGEGGGVRRVRIPMDSLDASSKGVAAALLDARLLSADVDTATGGRVLQVASEELLGSWQRLRGWVEEDRAFLAWRRQLAARAAGWEDGNRDRASLLRGEPLRTAEGWLRRGVDLSEDEARYIYASLHEARATRLRTRVLAVAVPILAVLGVYGLLRWYPFERVVTAEIPDDSSHHLVAGHESDFLVADGTRLSDQGVYGRALVFLDSAVHLDSTNVDARESRAITLLRAGNAAAAGQDFERVVRLSPRDPRGYVGLAEVQLARGDSVGAILTLRTAYALVGTSDQRSVLGTRLHDLGSRPVDRSIEVRGYTGSRSDSMWLRRIAGELDRAGYPLAQPWVPARNTTAEVRYFRDSRIEAADTIRAVVQRSLDAQNIPVRVALAKKDSLHYSAPPGSITIWLPPMEPMRRPAARPPR